MKSTFPIMICLLTVSALGLTACAPVQPRERGNLAKPQMALDPYPLQSALRAHNYGSREAAAGGNARMAGFDYFPVTWMSAIHADMTA